jgi:retron-type reverse transcriptase
MDKVWRTDVLWSRVGDGASERRRPGDRQATLLDVEEYGRDWLLGELATELREGDYRPLPARRVFIDKPGLPGEQRPLSIPSVRDRIVQAALKIVLEPVFEAIPHSELIKAVEERACDQSVLKLLRVMLRAGVMENGSVRKASTGTPQGGVISPLLCNVYLHRIDRAWDAREHGELVRYADDAVVMCRSRKQAEAALERLRHCWPTSDWSRRRPRPGSFT